MMKNKYTFKTPGSFARESRGASALHRISFDLSFTITAHMQIFTVIKSHAVSTGLLPSNYILFPMSLSPKVSHRSKSV